MNETLIEGVVFILAGIVLFIMNMKGIHFIFHLFGIIPIPLSFWMPIVMVMLGAFLLIH